MSRDPLGYVDGMILYRASFGVIGVDPAGLMTLSQDTKTWSEDWSEGTRNGRRFRYTEEDVAAIDRECEGSGWCFCVTRILVTHRWVQNQIPGGLFSPNRVHRFCELSYNLEGFWVKEKGNGFLPEIQYFEWWDIIVDGRQVNPTHGSIYEGLAQQTWHRFEVSPVGPLGGFWNGEHEDGERLPQNTAITACAVYDRCKGEFGKAPFGDENGRNGSLTFQDRPGINFIAGSAWSMHARFLMQVKNKCKACKD